MRIHRKSSLFGFGFLSGLLLFCLIYGPKVINPLYDSWLLSGGDLTQHYIGWIFFRSSDWNWPVGLFDSLTYPRKISITYLDAIPLLAIIFKSLRRFLPATFQYIGIWGILCFALQGGIGALILEKFLDRKRDIVLGTIMIILSPVLLQRMFWHSALGGHWIILLSIYLALKSWEEGRISFIRFDCCMVCVIAVLIHPYLAAISVMIFSLEALYRLVSKETGYIRCLTCVVIYLCCCLTGLLFMGAFSGLKPVFEDGFGDASANLNSFINNLGHSRVGKMLPVAVKYPEEGYCYLGLGVIILLILSIAGVIIKRSFLQIPLSKMLIILLSITGIWVMSCSPNICLNQRHIFRIPYPYYAVKLFNIFRSNGRFMWILFYVLFIWAITAAKRVFINRNSYSLILLLCVVIQIFDLSPVMLQKNGQFSKIYNYESSLKDSTWIELGENYTGVKFLSCKPDSKDRETYSYLGLQTMHDIAYFAYQNEMRLSDYYTARQDESESNKIKHIFWDELLNHEAEEGMVYIFPEQPDANLKFQDGFVIENIDNLWIGRLTGYR